MAKIKLKKKNSSQWELVDDLPTFGEGGKSNMRGGTYWEHRKSENDSDIENALEYMPGVGNLASVNDWMDSAQTLATKPSWTTLKEFGLESLGLVPFGNLVGKTGKLKRAGMALDGAVNSLSDEGVQFKNGGKLPKAEQGLRTPIPGTQQQYQAYQDSLSLYNQSQAFLNNPEYSSDSPGSEQQRQNLLRLWHSAGNNRPERFERRGEFSRSIPIYRRPVQPIQPHVLDINQPAPASQITPSTTQTYQDLQRQTERVNPLDIRPKETFTSLQPKQLSTLSPELPTQELSIPNIEKGYFTREQQGQETGGKSYFDKKTGKRILKLGGKVNNSEWELVN